MTRQIDYGARHRFLAELHELIQPETYLEIGVQRGISFRLAAPGCRAYGVDPNPLGEAYQGLAPMHGIYPMTSDEFFATVTVARPVDLAFIDGMHLIENVQRDFVNVQRLCHPGSVVVIDDVLPYDAAIAGREPLPGDWTGDVWKVASWLNENMPFKLKLTLVDVDPTGVLVVQGLDPADTTLADYLAIEGTVESWTRNVPVPEVFVRRGPTETHQAFRVYSPPDAMTIIEQHLNESRNA